MKALKKYLNKRESTIKSLLSRQRHEFTISTFHKLRVEIKKLNALFYLLNFCSKDYERRKAYRPFRKIFRKSGKIRELQLEEIFLKKHFPQKSLLVFRNSLKQLRIKEQSDFFSMIDHKYIKSTLDKFKHISPHLSEISRKRAKSFIAKKERKINIIVNNKSLKTKDIHKLRKQLKILNYTRKSLSIEAAENSHSNNDHLAGLLGKWHDSQVIVNHINKYQHKRKVIPSEKKPLEKIKSGLTLESKLVLNKINSIISKSNPK